MSETITFEYGAREVARFEGGTHVEASLKSQDELAKEYPGFDIKLLPYDSIHTPLSGGRQLLDLQPLDYLGIADLIRSYNQRGIPFMVPFNGGTSLPRSFRIDLLSDERLEVARRVLEVLAENGQRYGVQNSVTVARDDVRESVRSAFPDLSILASSLKFVGGYEGEFKGFKEYEDGFRDFDKVVIVNQHSTPDFLHRYREWVQKMVVFLTLGCDNRNLSKCFTHYAILDPSDGLDPDFNWRRFPGRILYIPNDSPYYPLQGDCKPDEKRGTLLLYSIRPFLIKLFEMGVRQFKFPRGEIINPLHRFIAGQALSTFSRKV